MWSHLLGFFIILCYSFPTSVCQLFVDDLCIPRDQYPDEYGICLNARNCWHVREDLKNGISPKICGFEAKESIVCCRLQFDAGPVNRMTPSCGPVPEGVTNVARTGQKAWDKCIDNLEYVYPCKNWTTCKSKDICDSTELARGYSCGHKMTQPRSTIPVSPQYVGRYRDAKEREFPHMALLGYGTSIETAKWSCSGTVVSESYVLTAAHCSVYSQYGAVSFIRVGMLQPSDPIDPSRLHRVVKIVLHPDMRLNDTFSDNDLALVMTNTPIKLDEHVYPACLHTGDTIEEHRMLATGWGLVGGISERLQKVWLNPKDPVLCNHYISPVKGPQMSLLKPSQLCVGDNAQRGDPCEMDPGGPIQVLNDAVDCTYLVLGVRSFPRVCGNYGKPAIYTRVSHFAPWIERIVWP